MEKRFQLLHEVSPISEELVAVLTKKWQVKKHLKRHEMLSELGARERYLYFVIRGELKICYPADGAEICAGFAYADTFICSFPSFISNQPSDYYIQAISPCELIGIAREDFYQIMEKHRALESCWRIMVERALIGRIERELEVLTLSPTEKFERLLHRSPHIFQLIPQKYLASYLGMTPETFSRAKRQYSLQQKT